MTPAEVRALPAHLIGKDVLVVLDNNTNDPLARLEGTLLSVDKGGQVRVRQADGEVRTGWPALKIVPLEGQEASG